ncbi:MAG: hypothetical protein WCW16_05485 [Candidatus Magasanikbacteria bacterium]
MKLSRLQFQELFDENKLLLSFIGMSNIGKTYWSKKLHEIGFNHINCDDLIEKKLEPALKGLGHSGIADVSRWMGQPYDERFSLNQAQYLLCEEIVMKNILQEMSNGVSQNTVIDTTGSMVHTDRGICRQLREYTMVIYIEESEHAKEKMFRQYLEEPKPVVFGNVYKPHSNETSTQTLQRCYPELLNLRHALYISCADIIIPRDAIDMNMTAHQFISLIQQSL